MDHKNNQKENDSLRLELNVVKIYGFKSIIFCKINLFFNKCYFHVRGKLHFILLVMPKKAIC